MKIRKGFVTNSSSTNFIIICEKELTFDYLYNKLNSSKNSVFESEIKELCNIILNSAKKMESIDISALSEKYGGQLDKVYKKFSKKSCYAYYGSTNSESSEIETFFTCEPIEFESSGFYLNGLNCVW